MPETSRRLPVNAVTAIVIGAAFWASMAVIAAITLISSRSGLLRHAGGSGVTMTFRLADDLPACRADETQLEIALVNLVVNARDGPAGPH